MNYRGQTWWTLNQLITALGTSQNSGTQINNMIYFLNTHPNPPPRNYSRRDTDSYPPSSGWRDNWFLALKNDLWNYYFPDFLQVNLSNFPGYYCAGFHYLVVKGFYQDLNSGYRNVTWIDSYRGYGQFGEHTLEYSAFASNIWVSANGYP